MYFAATVILMLALLAPGFSWADEVPALHDPRAAHAATDQNHDGEIDRVEFHNRIVVIFYFADTDKDGVVSNGQLKAFDEEELFRNAARDDDSMLSLKEFVDARFENFDAADADSDGTLTVQEVVEAFNE